MPGYNVSITQQQIYDVLQPFIALVTGLASNLVIQGVPNRSAMPPASPGFVAITESTLTPLAYTETTWDPADPSVTSVSVLQRTKFAIQIDVYGPNAQDLAQALVTLFRNDVGFQALGPTCEPLYCIDAVFAPLDDTEMQYEHRRMFELYVQYNPVVTSPVQSADTAGPVNSINVDERYPPT